MTAGEWLLSAVGVLLAMVVASLFITETWAYFQERNRK